MVGPRGRIIALDLQVIDPIPGVICLQGDMTDPEVQAQVIEIAGGHANVVLSDAAPSTTGVKLHDHVLSIELAQAAFDVASRLLDPGGNMVLKVFEGETCPASFVTSSRRFIPLRSTPPGNP